MDFVSRLKLFLEQRQIPITQFADNCRIPRPTLSQLLNGRNKKVSDEVIGKIHEAYPELSVMWLMFGEGEMMNGGAGYDTPQSSLPYTAMGDDDVEPGNPALDRQPGDSGYTFEELFGGGEPKGFQRVQSPQPVGGPRTTIDFPEANSESDPNIEISEGRRSQPTANPSVMPQQGNTRHRIVNIVVLYDDGKFESFIPEQ